MNFKHVKEQLEQYATSKKRGFGALNWLVGGFVAAISGIFLLAVFLYVLIQLATSLNNANVTTISNNVQLMSVNLSSQFGTIGTIGGVLMLVALIAALGLGGYSLYTRTKGGGGGSGM